MSGSGKPKVQRRLAAVLAADVVGFSTLMGEDEEGTLAQVKSLRREIIEPGAVEHHGRIVKTTGDGFLVEFSSPTESVQCAVEMLEALASRAAERRTQQTRVPARALGSGYLLGGPQWVLVV
jgi:adenylate cyclase